MEAIARNAHRYGSVFDHAASPLHVALHLPRARADAFLPHRHIVCGWGYFPDIERSYGPTLAELLEFFRQQTFGFG
ncbi:TPA: hypothetical protein SAY52_004714 [Burkholderia cenocepacia]|jgi:hypothetical protein|uniref:hypothetical protein n=1 Tax=unclassified Burkholderia TaxID=2613784 RepID=UPI00158DA29A|nr:MULTISPECIES: hypothetical protein [unclassified Burkholderia]HEF5874047.1 hypothetical protein [Burkholderia cenocepacia]